MNDECSLPTSATSHRAPARGLATSGRTATAEEARLANLAKALGHPARVRILRLLLATDACICSAICDVVSLAQSTVSQHLKVLKQAGLIAGEIDGPRVCYSPNRAALAELTTLLDHLEPDANAGRKEFADA